MDATDKAFGAHRIRSEAKKPQDASELDPYFDDFPESRGHWQDSCNAEFYDRQRRLIAERNARVRVAVPTSATVYSNSSDIRIETLRVHVDPLIAPPPPLAALRRRRRISQKEVATQMSRAASTVCELERTEVEKLSLRRIDEFISALGGRLEVTAAFDDERVELY